MYKILGITGPSGCGKDTAARYLATHFPSQFSYVKLCTTRPKRDNEEDEYEFLSAEDFLSEVLSGSMLNAQEYNDWYYGLSKYSLDDSKINVLPMSEKMIEQMTEEIRNDYELKIIYINTFSKLRLLHILQREEYPNCYEICRRFLADQKDYVNNTLLIEKCYKVINNDYTEDFFLDLESMVRTKSINF